MGWRLLRISCLEKSINMCDVLHLLGGTRQDGLHYIAGWILSELSSGSLSKNRQVKAKSDFSYLVEIGTKGLLSVTWGKSV